MSATIGTSFDDVEITDLSTMSSDRLDTLPFGVIGVDRGGIARVYNATEARSAGLPPSAVLGVPFFDAVAQCMNNFMVAQRFHDHEELDEVVPFVLTLRMRPTPVKLRLLASASEELRFVLIQR